MILLVVNHPVGGIKTYLKYIYSHEIFSGYNFIMMIPEYHRDMELESYYDNFNIRIVYYKNKHIDFLNKIRHIFQNENISLIHSHGYTSCVISSIPACLFFKKHLLTCHDVFNKEQFYGFSGVVKKIFLTFTFKLTKKIHCVTYDARNNFVETLPMVNKRKITVIENGILVSNFINCVKRDYFAEFNLREDDYIVGFLGRFMSQKGFRYLVDAIEILNERSNGDPGIKVIAIGDGGFKKEEMESVRSRKLQDIILFAPATDEVGSALKGMDLVAMPSLWEAAGILAMETLAVGVPLVATNCVGLREVLKDTPAKVIGIRDSKALADAIFLMKETRQYEVFNSFRQEAIKRYDISNTSISIEKLYEDITGHEA